MSKPFPDRLVLTADVGGTNLNLALVAYHAGNFELLRQWRGSTQGTASLLEPAQRFLAECLREGYHDKPSIACISGAGPVVDGRIALTNAPWDIEAEALKQGLGMPVQLVNDFSAISHGVLLLDPGDARQLLPLPHSDAALPTPDPTGTVLIVGAGTGLGVGYVTRTGGSARICPSEGGHIALPVMDELGIDLWRHLRAGLSGPPGAELAVSGPGIAALHAFLTTSDRFPRSAATERLLALPVAERPAAIAAHALEDEACGRAMDLFVDLYARVCADLCAVFLPTGGLFLAGGIASKNADRFTAGQRFMTHFEQNYRAHIDAITRATPVYIVRDYNISLFGAARAAILDPQ